MTEKGVKTMPKTEYVIQPGKQELSSTTILDAPRELVFRAYTDPKLFAQWWGPRRYEIKIDKFDSRAGGEWRVIHKGADGAEYGFRGVNHDVVAPERICATFEFEGVPGHVALQTATEWSRPGCRRAPTSRWSDWRSCSRSSRTTSPVASQPSFNAAALAIRGAAALFL